MEWFRPLAFATERRDAFEQELSQECCPICRRDFVYPTLVRAVDYARLPIVVRGGMVLSIMEN
jgi:hypothetical protein